MLIFSNLAGSVTAFELGEDLLMGGLAGEGVLISFSCSLLVSLPSSFRHLAKEQRGNTFGLCP